ncbi:MAG: rRNA maturation RNase YbeY [Pseudomonadota bacterium]
MSGSARRSDAARRGRRRGPRLALSIHGRERFAGLPAPRTLRRWVQLALERDAEIAVSFVDARAGRRLNRAFRGRDYATNVLTFDYAQRPRVVADIAICVPVVRREAREQGKTVRAHLAHLVIHGTLHAQGYDHRRRAEARLMEAREVELLAKLRIADPYT